jgi:hypothetical protein
MAKRFNDLMNQAGYSSRDVSDPTVVREREETGLGAGTSSDSSGSDQGPSCRFQDDFGRLLKPNRKQVNDVRSDFDKEASVNPYTEPSETVPPASVEEATGNKKVSAETAARVEELLAQLRG